MKKIKWWLVKHFGKKVVGVDISEKYECKTYARHLFGLMYVYDVKYRELSMSEIKMRNIENQYLKFYMTNDNTIINNNLFLEDADTISIKIPRKSDINEED